MHTLFHVRQPYLDIFLDCAEKYENPNANRPIRFIKKMRENQGSVAGITGRGMDESGLERRNPVIVVMGDSVTAGHFEGLVPSEEKEAEEYIKKHSKDPDQYPLEITDVRESYPDKFRAALIDKYQLTSVSVLNAGIAGDHLISMTKRAGRDIICHQPDLVIINGCLNWGKGLGSTEEYKEILRGLVRRIRMETEADVILLTPNGDIPSPFLMNKSHEEHTTPRRVAVIRELAEEERICLADTYAVWENAREKGCPWEELLANGINHPAAIGHDVYAKVLMKLFE